MARHRSPLWGRGCLLGKDKAVRIKKVPRTKGENLTPGGLVCVCVTDLLRLDVWLLEAEVVLLVDGLEQDAEHEGRHTEHGEHE